MAALSCRYLANGRVLTTRDETIFATVERKQTFRIDNKSCLPETMRYV